jgi:glycosyltransferase involved in cell wall biosynthesis
MADKTYPAVSCYTSTYGRVHCLEEVVECFLKQNYPGKKELIILNDFAEQELIYNHNEIRIINSKERIKPLGTKFNKNIEYCQYEILCCMEDDDYYLPNHLTYAVDNMHRGVYHSGVAWVWTAPGKLHRSGNYFHGNHVIKRDLFEKVGRYPDIDNCTVDVGIMAKIQKELGTNYSQSPKPEEMTYIYRWGCGSYHGSGYGTNITNVSELAANAVQHQKSLGKVPTGKVILNPHWREDYVALAKKATEDYYAAN